MLGSAPFWSVRCFIVCSWCKAGEGCGLKKLDRLSWIIVWELARCPPLVSRKSEEYMPSESPRAFQTTTARSTDWTGESGSPSPRESRSSRATSLTGSEVGEAIADLDLTPKDESSRLSAVEGLQTWWRTTSMSWPSIVSWLRRKTWAVQVIIDFRLSYFLDPQSGHDALVCNRNETPRAFQLTALRHRAIIIGNYDFDRKRVPCFKVWSTKFRSGFQSSVHCPTGIESQWSL